MTHRRPRRQRGGALVEGALVLGIFLFTFIGIVDFAQILYLHQSLVERVRGAARTAVVDTMTEGEIRNLVVYGVKEPSTDSKGFFGLVPANVSVAILDRTTTESRLVVRITGLRFIILSPLMSRMGTNLPVQVTAPLEEP